MTGITNLSIDSVVQDARYAFRQIRRSPVVAAVSIASLAIAIGAGSGVFALARAAFAMRTQEEQIARYLSRDRFFATLGTLPGGAAALLACIGLYGLLSYAVTRRTPELGVRLALGASPGRLAASVIRESLLLAMAGAALGVPATYAMGRAAEASLFGVNAANPVLLILASVVLAAVSAGAAFLPARRAARVDPLLALRSE